MALIKISEIEQVFKDIFDDEEGKVGSVNTLYELSEDETFYKLVITLNSASMKDVFILHTRFVFKVNLEKTEAIDDSFIYLYDLNCVYHRVDFTTGVDMKNKIKDIFESNDFGSDLIILSDFAVSPSLFINHYLRKAKITEYSVFNVKYEPKYKHVPCDQLSFDFEVDVNNNYIFNVNIKKVDIEGDNELDKYVYKFQFLDTYETVEMDDLKNIHYVIGSTVAKILDEKTK